jgi:hypothetical protein
VNSNVHTLEMEVARLERALRLKTWLLAMQQALLMGLLFEVFSK